MRYRWQGEALGDMVAVDLNNMEVMIMILIRNGNSLTFVTALDFLKKENDGFRLAKNQLKQLWTLEGLYGNILKTLSPAGARNNVSDFKPII